MLLIILQDNNNTVKRREIRLLLKTNGVERVLQNKDLIKNTWCKLSGFWNVCGFPLNYYVQYVELN